MAGIHARCLATDDSDPRRLLICGKSKGHVGSEHFDPDTDRRWNEAANPTAKEES